MSATADPRGWSQADLSEKVFKGNSIPSHKVDETSNTLVLDYSLGTRIIEKKFVKHEIHGFSFISVP